MPVTTLDPKTALIVVDLQKGIVGLPLAGAITVAFATLPARAQDASGLGDLKLPGLSGYATGKSAAPLAQAGSGDVTLSAQLTDKGADITRGLVWRVFKPDPGPDGKLPLVASAHGGNATFQLDPGSYLVHAAYGRAGATKRITVTKEARHENLVLDAGGLELDAVSADGVELPAGKLRIKTGGGAGGHNGIRSIIQHIGEDFRRVRIGIGHPGSKDRVLSAVLGDFSKAEMKWVEPLLDVIVAEAPLLGEGRFNSFANRVHLALNPEPEKPEPKRKPQDGTKKNGDE